MSPLMVVLEPLILRSPLEKIPPLLCFVDPVKKREIGSAYEWLTCSITREEYEKLGTYLSDRDDGCRHKED